MAYSFLNSFSINTTGEFDVKIYFRGQDYVTIGGTVSALTWVVVLFYLAYPRIKRWRITLTHRTGKHVLASKDRSALTPV